MRIRRLLVNPELLMFIENGTFRVLRSGLPKDAILTQTTIDPMTGEIQLFIHSAEFEDVPPGEIPPLHPRPVLMRVEA